MVSLLTFRYVQISSTVTHLSFTAIILSSSAWPQNDSVALSRRPWERLTTCQCAVKGFHLDLAQTALALKWFKVQSIASAIWSAQLNWILPGRQGYQMAGNTFQKCPRSNMCQIWKSRINCRLVSVWPNLNPIAMTIEFGNIHQHN